MAIRLELFRFQIKHEVFVGYVVVDLLVTVSYFAVYHRIEKSSTTVILGITRLPRQRAFASLVDIWAP